MKGCKGVPRERKEATQSSSALEAQSSSASSAEEMNDWK